MKNSWLIRDNSCSKTKKYFNGTALLNGINKQKSLRDSEASFVSCGGRTRTCDLQVMSLASYQLLHSAIIFIRFCKPFCLFAGAKVQLFCELHDIFSD